MAYNPIRQSALKHKPCGLLQGTLNIPHRSFIFNVLFSVVQQWNKDFTGLKLSLISKIWDFWMVKIIILHIGSTVSNSFSVNVIFQCDLCWCTAQKCRPQTKYIIVIGQLCLINYADTDWLIAQFSNHSVLCYSGIFHRFTFSFCFSVFCRILCIMIFVVYLVIIYDYFLVYLSYCCVMILLYCYIISIILYCLLYYSILCDNLWEVEGLSSSSIV